MHRTWDTLLVVDGGFEGKLFLVHCAPVLNIRKMTCCLICLICPARHIRQN